MKKKPTQKKQIYIQRFVQFLNASNQTFSVITHQFTVFNANVSFVFSNGGVEIIRPHLPDRCIPYDKLNFDRLLMLK